MLGPMGRQGAAPLADNDEPVPLAAEEEPYLPAYGAGSLSDVVPTLLGRGELAAAGALPAWLPAPLGDVDQVVLLVLDGLGYEQLVERAEHAPALCSMEGGAITSVVPTTTATALTSLASGAVPADHGVLGYRLRTGEADVLNVLRWSIHGEDARQRVPPAGFCRRPPFLSSAPPVVTRAEFAGTGFTEAHLPGVRLVGWRVPSSIRVEVAALVAAGEPFVYAYYDGVDKVAHEYGLAEHYDAELASADRLVADVADALPPGAALVVTSDHGQVHVGDAIVPIHEDVMASVELLSGEGRFRWLHARSGALDDLAAAARECHGSRAWVRTREEVIADEWFGPKVSEPAAARFGDVVLAAIDPVAFEDPADTGPYRLQCRHGSLTPAEMRIPLVGLSA